MSIRKRRVYGIQNLFFTLSLILCLGVLSSCDGQPSNPFENLKTSSHLTDDEKEVEKRFIDRLKNNPEEMIAEYRRRFDNIVNTDLARELSEDYEPNAGTINKLARTKWSRATLSPSRTLAKAVYEKMLTEETDNEPIVVFTAGGAGSGKSTAIGDDYSKLIKTASIIFDTTLSSESSTQLIENALTSGYEVTIIYVYRPPVDAFMSMLERANKTGRPVTLNEFLDSHLEAPLNLSKITQSYIGHKNLAVMVLDNSYKTGEAITSDLNWLNQVTENITHKNLRGTLKISLERALNNKMINKEIYDAILK